MKITEKKNTHSAIQQYYADGITAQALTVVLYRVYAAARRFATTRSKDAELYPVCGASGRAKETVQPSLDLSQNFRIPFSIGPSSA